MISEMLKLCQHELEIDDFPPIEFIDEPFLKGGNKYSFGEFDGSSIKVITKNRHPMDVMRTLAHELVHWKQMCEKQPMDGNDGSETENAANAVAGIIMRRFGERYPEYFMDILPNN
jgi:hypothetical protein